MVDAMELAAANAAADGVPVTYASPIDVFDGDWITGDPEAILGNSTKKVESDKSVRRVGTVVGAMVVLTTLTTGCASNEGEARDAAIEDMRTRLAEITESASELIRTKNPQAVSERVDYLYGENVYRHSASRTEASWQVILTADASYSEFIGEHQAVIGTCIEVVAKKSDGVDTTTANCPKNLWKRDMIDNYDEEVDILDD